MSEPPGQTRSELPAPGGEGTRTVISSARDVEQGARSMLILAEGLFRLDVIPHDDTIQTIVRCLAPGARAEARYSPVGGVSQTVDTHRPPSTGRFGGEIVLLDEAGSERTVARFLVGSVCHVDRGATSFTAQATLA